MRKPTRRRCKLSPDESVLRIFKDKEDWKWSVEIKDNSKGEPAVTVKARSDTDVKDAGEEALKEYRRVHKELKVEDPA